MGLSDANSSYNALQVFLSKRRGDLSFTLNYTLGRSNDNGSGNFDNPADGPEDIDYYWGPSDFDRTHIFVAHLELPAALLQEQPGLPRATCSAAGRSRASPATRRARRSPSPATPRSAAAGPTTSGGDIYLDERINPTTGVVQWINPRGVRPGPRGPARQQRARPGPRAVVLRLGHLAAQGVQDLRRRPDADPGRLLQRLQPRQLGQPEQQPTPNLSNAGFGTITAITGQPRNIQLGARIMF